MDHCESHFVNLSELCKTYVNLSLYICNISEFFACRVVCVHFNIHFF